MKFFAHDHLYMRLKERTGGRTRFVHRIGRDPLLDWGVIVFVAMSLSACFIADGFLAYYNVGNTLAAAEQAKIGGHTINFDTKALDAMLGVFATRANTSNSLLKMYNGPADPSL